jgi:hypothetical protein
MQYSTLIIDTFKTTLKPYVNAVNETDHPAERLKRLAMLSVFIAEVNKGLKSRNVDPQDIETATRIMAEWFAMAVKGQRV